MVFNSFYLHLQNKTNIMIRYKKVNRNYVTVLLENKEVGSIVMVAGGFQYRPKGKNRQSFYGEVLSSIEEVKSTL